MKQLAVLSLVAAAALAACNHDAPTAQPLDEVVAAPAGISASVSAAAAADAELALEDLSGRMVPLLSNAGVAEQVQGHIASARTSLAAGDGAGARSALARATAAVDSDGDGSGAETGDPAEAAVILLLLGNVSDALGR